jgi:hypothetical protein
MFLVAFGSNSVKNQWLVESATLYAPVVVGNPLELATPLIRIWPCGERAMPLAVDIAEPPISTEKITPCKVHHLHFGQTFREMFGVR